MIKTKIKFLITIIIFALLMIPSVCDATENLTYGNFNYHIETDSIFNGEYYTYDEYIILDSLIDTTVEELRIPATINGIRVDKFADEINNGDGTYTHILTSATNLKKIIFENNDFDIAATSYYTSNSTVEEIVIEEKIFGPSDNTPSMNNTMFPNLKTVYGYGENTRLKAKVEAMGYTYMSLGENNEHIAYEDDTPNVGIAINVATENVVVNENINKITFLYKNMIGAGFRNEVFSENIVPNIKTIRFETKKQLYVYDQKELVNVETVYGYTGTGAETVAENIGAEFVSLGTVEEVNLFKYEKIEDTDHSYIRITGLNRVPPNVIEFPETIEGLPVEVIAENFITYIRYGMVVEQNDVVIPATVKKVENGAFDGMHMLTLKVLSKDIEYLDDFSMNTGTYSYILCSSIVVSAYDESGMLDVVKKYFPETYEKHYVSLNELEYTTEETKDITVDEKEITIMPIDGKTNVKDFIVKENFPIIGTYKVKVLDATKANEKTDTDKIGSRNVIQIIEEKADGTEKILAEYLVIVNGDVNGDGDIKMYDSFQILKGAILPGAKLDAIDTLIRDSNNDGLVLLFDAFQFLKKAILGI